MAHRRVAAPALTAPRAGTVAALVAAACVVATTAAVIVVIAGLGDAVRGALGLTLPPPPHALPDAVGYAISNLRVAVVPLASALVVGIWPRARRLLDVLLALVLTVNAALIGAAVGAYGTDLVRHLAWHGPLELVSFAVAGAAYVDSRRAASLQLRLVASSAAVTIVGVVVAALLESGWRP